MVKPIQIFPSTGDRRVAREPFIALKNRFCEANPVLNDTTVSLISRPAQKYFTQVGDGPIRKLFSQAGVFDNSLFAVSGGDLYRIDPEGVSSFIGTLSGAIVGDVSMCATAPVLEQGVPAYLYIAEGSVLWVYTDDSAATGTLTISGAITDGDRVVIGGVYYSFTSGSVDTGTPAGTNANPWLVSKSINVVSAIQNLFVAMDAAGVAGTDYSTTLEANPLVKGFSTSATQLTVAALEKGLPGNSIATTETGANMGWGGTTLAGGGTESLRQVEMPDDVGAISVATINSYVIVVPAQGEDINGRFFWIDPGENTIDPLNFATAERSPDGIHQVVVFGDMFWLMGQTTTEPWITTGNSEAPMARFTGILFDRGSWPGTATQVKDSLIVVDQDGGVFQINNGQKRISTPYIEDLIRRAILAQAVQ